MTVIRSTEMVGDKFDIFDVIDQDRPDSEIKIVTVDGIRYMRASIFKPEVASDKWSDKRARAEVTFRDGYERTHTHLFYGLKMMLQEDFTTIRGSTSTPNLCLINQLKTGNSSQISLVARIHSPNPSAFHLLVKQRDLPDKRLPLPDLGGIFDIIYEVDAVEEGLVRCWINEVQEAETGGDQRPKLGDYNKGTRVPYLKAGIYQAIDQNMKQIFVSKMIVATTFEEVNTFLTGVSPPTPEPDPPIPDPPFLERRVCLLSFFLDIDGVKYTAKPDTPITFTLTEADS